MKKCKTICRISVKMGTADGDLFKILLSEGRKVKVMRVDPGLTVYCLNGGTILELYGPGACYPEYLFKSTSVVLGFKVEDIEKMILKMQTSGAKLLGNIEMICNALIYCHLKLKNETVIGLYQDLLPGN